MRSMVQEFSETKFTKEDGGGRLIYACKNSSRKDIPLIIEKSYGSQGYQVHALNIFIRIKIPKIPN